MHLTTRARTLRRNLTPPERALWHALRARQLGVKFRRQHPVGAYIADFACVEARLVVEVDGATHAEAGADAARDLALRAQGWRVLPVWNNDVIGNLEGVLQVIAEALAVRPPP